MAGLLDGFLGLFGDEDNQQPQQQIGTQPSPWFQGSGTGQAAQPMRAAQPVQDNTSFLGRLTGIPDTDGRAQGMTLGMGLLNAASAIANANRPSFYGTPSTGSLIAAGAGGFGDGLGVAAMQRQRAAVAQARQAMQQKQFETMQAREGREQTQWDREQEGWNQLKAGADPQSIYGPAGERALRMMQYRQAAEQARQGNALGWAQLAESRRGRELANRPRPQYDDRLRGYVNPDGSFTPVQLPEGYSVPGDGGKAQYDAKLRAWVSPNGQVTPAQVPDDYKIPGKSGNNMENIYSNIVLEDIGKAKNLARDYTFIPTTGWGDIGPRVPGSTASDLAATLNTIKASVGFDRLKEMRASSPTGAGVGSVSNEENVLMQSALGSLEQSQSEEQFLKNLDRAERVYLNIVHGHGNWIQDGKGNIRVGSGIGINMASPRQSGNGRMNADAAANALISKYSR